jgi:hypothetical protein
MALRGARCRSRTPSDRAAPGKGTVTLRRLAGNRCPRGTCPPANGMRKSGRSTCPPRWASSTLRSRSRRPSRTCCPRRNHSQRSTTRSPGIHRGCDCHSPSPGSIRRTSTGCCSQGQATVRSRRSRSGRSLRTCTASPRCTWCSRRVCTSRPRRDLAARDRPCPKHDGPAERVPRSRRERRARRPRRRAMHPSHLRPVSRRLVGTPRRGRAPSFRRSRRRPERAPTARNPLRVPSLVTLDRNRAPSKRRPRDFREARSSARHRVRLGPSGTSFARAVDGSLGLRARHTVCSRGARPRAGHELSRPCA